LSQIATRSAGNDVASSVSVLNSKKKLQMNLWVFKHLLNDTHLLKKLSDPRVNNSLQACLYLFVFLSALTGFDSFLLPYWLRTRPLHDRSPNRPSQATTSRPLPRPAYRGTKNASSPTATDLDSPIKAKGKGKIREFPMDGTSPVADKRVEKSSSFPCISPLASPTRAKHKRRQFPNLSPLSSAAKAKIVDSDAEEDDDNDELGMDSGDDILTRGAPRPFPMSTQMLQSIQRTEKRLSGGVGENGTQGNKRTDDDTTTTCM
jgi:hypothetical protein